MMDDSNFVAVFLSLIIVHAACLIGLYGAVKRVQYRMEEKKTNKKTRNAFEDSLRRQRVIIIALPIIGPMLGLAACLALNSGHQDAGKKVNSPADNHSPDSD